MPFPGFQGLHNSRLVDTCNALIEVSEYAQKHKIGTVLFGGDLFHTRQAVKTSAYNLVYHVLKKHFNDLDIELVMIPGNHDYADRQGAIHSLSTLKYLSTVSILDTVTKFPIPNTMAMAFSVPYTDDVKQAKENLKQAAELAQGVDGFTKILLAHLGTEGAIVGSDFVMLSPQDITVDDIPLGVFDLCLFGHYHQHQMIAKNAWYIGALTEQNRSDAGGKRGFLDIEITDNGLCNITQIQTQAPRFIVCDTPEAVRNARPKDFVYYQTSSILTHAEQLELRDLSPSITIEPVKKDMQGITVDPSHLNANNALPPWVEANAGNLDKQRLLRMGERLLAKGQGYALQED